MALACHPLPSIAVTAGAAAFAAAVGRGVAGSALVAVTVLASQLSIGWENDYLDLDRDRLREPAAPARIILATLGDQQFATSASRPWPAPEEFVAVNLRIRRAAATAAVVLALPAALASCGVGFDAPTTQVAPPYPSGDVGPMQVRSLMLIQKDGGGPASAVVTLVNRSNEPQALRALQIAPPQTDGGSPAASRAAPLDVPAAITVPAGAAVHVGSQGQPTVTVNGLDAVARPGQVVPVTLIFDKAGRITLNVVIQAGVGQFASFAPTAEPSPATTEPSSATSSPSTTESASPTSSPTASSTG